MRSKPRAESFCFGDTQQFDAPHPLKGVDWDHYFQISDGGLDRATTKLRLPFHNVGMTVRRLKTYTGAQGYVYQYYFVGKRPALDKDPEAPATEFVFDVTSDRKLTYAVSVFLPEGPRAEWGRAHGRPLNDAEQYAAVKLRLFRAFDELEDVKRDGRRLTIDSTLLEEALTSLGVD